jgi:hypothetical protein
VGIAPKKFPEPLIGGSTYGPGYWLADQSGGVAGFSHAFCFQPMSGDEPVAPVVGIAADVNGLGYWLVAAGGGVFTFGDATYLGSS